MLVASIPSEKATVGGGGGAGTNEPSKAGLSASFMRMVAVSATLPNVSDIGAFMCALPSSTFCFGNDYRPVPLKMIVKACGTNTSDFFFDKSLTNFVPSIISEHSSEKPTIVFCHTKKDTETLCLALGKSGSYISSQAQRSALTVARSKAMDYNLKQSLLLGTAYHHAGLQPSDRHLIESMFMQNHIKVLCATSTLAMGINLPAHLVVIKGTRAWRGGGTGHQDIDIATLTQMMGRAGRPGLDTSGVAVVMTDSKSKSTMDRRLAGSEIVESMLRSSIIETLNAEISQGVITDIPTALTWIKSTFYYVRVKQRPNFYDVLGTTNQEIDHYLHNMIMEALEALAQFQVIKLVDSIDIFPQDASLVMAQNIVPFESMKMFIQLEADGFGPSELLHVLSQCTELQTQIRRSEKKGLNEMHKNLPYRIKTELAPSKFRANCPSHKAFILLQASISKYSCENYTMQAEMVRMVDYATRMLSAIEDYSVGTTLHGNIALESMLLKRCFDTCLWKGSDGMLNQFPGVGEKTTNKLLGVGVVSFRDVLEANLVTLEKAAGRKAPFGDELKLAAARILADSLSVTAEIDKDAREVSCRITNFDKKANIKNEDGWSYFDKVKRKESAMSKVKKSSYVLIVFTDHPAGLLMWRTGVKEAGLHTVRLPEKWGKVTVRLVSSFVGLDIQSEICGGDDPFVSKALEAERERKQDGLTKMFSPNKRLKVGKKKGVELEAQRPLKLVPTMKVGTDGVDVSLGSDASAAAAPNSPQPTTTKTTVMERAEAFAAGKVGLRWNSLD